MGTTQNTAAIYIRRSALDERDADGSDNRSLTSQERDCRQWAEREGLTVTHVYRERVGTSASHLKTNRRPQMERALDEMGSSYSTLIVWAFDRATRKGLAEAGVILDRVDKVGGRLVSVTDGVDTSDPTARLIIAIRSEMARDEMTKMSARVRRGKEEQRRRGEYLGGSVPYGLQVVREPGQPVELEVDQEAAEVIRQAATMITDGASLITACKALNADDHRTAQGAAWSGTTLRRILRSPHMLGHRRYGGDVYRDDEGSPVVVTDPILTEAQFRRVDKALAARRRVTNNMSRGQTTVKPRTSMLGGLLRCGECAASMAATTYTKSLKDGSRRSYGFYRCATCRRPGHSIDMGLVEERIARMALSFLSALEPDSTIVEEVGRRWMARFSPEQLGRHEEIREELDVVEGRHRLLQTEFYEAGTMDTDVYTRLDRNLSERIAALREELLTTPSPKADLSALLDLTQSADNPTDIVGPGSAWTALADYERREIIRVLVDAVTVERRDKPGQDVEGRLVVEFATESNVTHLANRSERILGKHVSRAPKVVAR